MLPRCIPWAFKGILTKKELTHARAVFLESESKPNDEVVLVSIRQTSAVYLVMNRLGFEWRINSCGLLVAVVMPHRDN